MVHFQAASESDDDELFRVRGTGPDAAACDGAGAELDAVDSSRPAPGGAQADLSRWDGSGAAEQLRDRFVTGAWCHSILTGPRNM